MESMRATASTAASPAATVGTNASNIAPAPSVTPAPDHGSGHDSENVRAKRQKKATSAVWEFYDKYTKTHELPDGRTEEQLWAKCKRCKYEARAESVRGTSAFSSHLKNKHSVNADQATLNLVKVDDNTAAVQAYKYDKAVSLRKWETAVVMHDYPFKMVEHEYFNDFIKSLRPGFEFMSRNTTRDRIVETYKMEKQKIYEFFSSVSSRVSATMDMWTSNQNKSYMCITAHWIDAAWEMQRRIIKFSEVKGSHTGIRLADEFLQGVMVMNLEKKLFALTLDNAANNDKCVETLLPQLNKISPLVCDGMFFHVRCLCHILNIVAQDGLKAIASTVKNIRSTFVIIKNSPLQFELFQKCAKEENLQIIKGIPLDVPTRWNSTFEMLMSAIYYRKALDKLVVLNKKKYRKCAPTDAEWNIAFELTKFLKKFHDTTVLFSRSTAPTANLFWEKFCDIKLSIDNWCGSENNMISTMATAMKVKYDKYWALSNRSLAVGEFLDPRYKKKFVEYFLRKIYPCTYEVEMGEFMRIVNKLFLSYKSSTPVHAPARAQPTNSEPSHMQIDDLFEENSAKIDIVNFLNDSAGADKTELELYIESEPIVPYHEQIDILTWWKNKRTSYPILSRLARDVLAVQVSTVASESAFSAGGRVVDPFRTRLDPEVVEALVCSKDWIAAAKRSEMLKQKKIHTIDSLLDELDVLELQPREKEASTHLTDQSDTPIFIESEEESD